MSTEIQEVEEVLSGDSPIGFEEILDETNSPLNQPVIEKDIVGSFPPVNSEPEEQFVQESDPFPDAQKIEQPTEAFDDVPEQEINVNPDFEESDEEPEPEPELPDPQAKQAADTLIGMTNNILAVGGGFFVKIEKDKSFYEYDEVVKAIDEKNDQNVSRLQFDKEDKSLLKPLLVTILKKKAKNLTPEQQLMGALLTISFKKVQTAMEIRKENEQLTSRIKDMIREENKARETTETPVEESEGGSDA